MRFNRTQEVSILTMESTATVKGDAVREKREKEHKHPIGYVYLKYSPFFVLAIALLLVQAVCDLSLPTYMSKIISEGIGGSDMSKVTSYGVQMLIRALISVACAVSVSFIAAFTASRMSKTLRDMLYVKITGFSSAEFDKFSVASLITRSTNDLTQIQSFVVLAVRILLYAPALAVGGILRSIELSQGMSDFSLVYVIIGGVIAVLLSLIVIMAIVMPRYTKIQKVMDKLNLVAREGLSGMMVVRAFNTQEHEEKRFDDVNNELTGLNRFSNRTMAAMMPLLNLVMSGMTIAIIWVASNTVQNIAAVGDMMAFSQYATQIILSFVMVTVVLIIMPRALVCQRRIKEVLVTPVSIVNREDAVSTPVTGKIEFRHVSFRYGDSEENVLTDIDFTVEPGTTTAIIGSTGCGKSSIVNLIPRVYDASEGEVLIDGVDVRDYDLDYLRSKIAFVPQKNVLFTGTVASNIKYADSDATDEQMLEAAEISQSKEFVEAKPDKYDSDIVEGGTNVSGGQRQRLAIARAVLKKSPIFVFDDSFSALDFKTDATLRAALNEHIEASKIIVAQRVGTIMSADQILVIDQGKIVGKGRHEELLKTCDVYSEIAHSQMSEEELTGGKAAKPEAELKESPEGPKESAPAKSKKSKGGKRK